MTEYPLLPIPTPEISERPGGRWGNSQPEFPSHERQVQRLQPIFQRLQSVFDDNRDPLSLRDDPTAIAPERVLVFEVAGSIDRFSQAVKKVPGLEYLGEEEISFDPDEDFAYYKKDKEREEDIRDDKQVDGRLYLSMPDVRALRELSRLWERYRDGHKRERGFSPWHDVFEQLRDLRPWGPSDRISEDTITFLERELDSHTDPVRMEVELWSYKGKNRQQHANANFEEALQCSDGVVIHKTSIPEIAYEAMLIDLPASQARNIAQHSEVSLATCDEIMWIRPQTIVSCPTEIEPLDEDNITTPVILKNDQPIVALLDGLPIQNHSRLDSHIRLDDPDGLEYMSTVAKRRHGTAMASLILNGDINLNEPPLQRPIHMHPILYAPGNQQNETPRKDRLLIDTIYKAVIRMKKGDRGEEPTAPDAFIVNLSIGINNRLFANIISPLARLLDYLAEEYGILFIVSAGNINDNLEILNLYSNKELENQTSEELAITILSALKRQRSQRTLLSPAEAVNIVTIGSWHEDDRASPTPSHVTYTPYSEGGPNISSALGLGYLKTIKPDIYMPGGREHFQVISSSKKGLEIKHIPAGRFYGLKAAVPDEETGQLNKLGFTSGSSAATALATRGAHLIFDSIQDNELFNDIDPTYYGVIIKSLLVHTAKWDNSLAQLFDQYINVEQNIHHFQHKDNTTPFFGYGVPKIMEAISCSFNRATLIGVGSITDIKRAHGYRVPLPDSLDRVKEPRSVTLTLAWFSPINTRRRDYRRAKLEIYPDDFKIKVGIKRDRYQPSHTAIKRGSLIHDRYEGKRAVDFVDNGHLSFKIFRRDQDSTIDKPVRYGVAVTIEAGEHIPVYQEVKERLAVRPRVTR